RGKKEELERLQQMQARPGQISYTRQQEPLGLGHAVWCARELVGDEPFALLLPDMIMAPDQNCTRQMVDLHAQTGGNIVAVEECDPQDTGRYGIVARGEAIHGGFRVTGMVEKP